MHTFAKTPKATQLTAFGKSTLPGLGHITQSKEVRSILHPRRSISNQAVQQKSQMRTAEREGQLTRASTHHHGHDFSGIPLCTTVPKSIQTKLTINRLGDRYEQEADRVSEQIMRMPELRVQPKCAGSSMPGFKRKCGNCGKENLSLQCKSRGFADPVAGGFAPPLVHGVLRSPGQSLDHHTRAFMEPHFGRDFSRVRLHTDLRASDAADVLQAQAFTVGNDIVFGTGKFAPSTPAGRKLLAHELTHVVQQGAAPAAATHSPVRTAGEGATKANDVRTSPISGSGCLQRQAKGGENASKTEACPPMERNEREDAAKAQLQIVSRIPQQEWLIYGFPIGGTELSDAEAGGFISAIVRSLMQGHFVYMTGQDPLEVLGFSDCFTGPQVDNHAIRQLRAANFCAGVKEHYSTTPKTYPALIRSCGPAPIDQYVGSNATKADRAQNRSILVRRVAPAKVQFKEGNETYPYNPKYGPSTAHCAAYKTTQARDILGRVYTNNAHCSCMVTPDEPHNNCVRDCLQDKMWTLLAAQTRGREPGDPPMDINIACPLIWKHHRDCYHDCGCASEFIHFLAFYAVCNIALPCAIDSAAINLMNRCMPATENDRYLPVD